MAVRNTFYFLIGFVISASLISVSFALTSTEIKQIETEQQYAKQYTGTFQPNLSDEKFQIHTYETICKGYYVKEITDTTIRYTGFGDLADEYTYTVDLPVVDTLENSSSTFPIDEKILDTDTVVVPVDSTSSDTVGIDF